MPIRLAFISPALVQLSSVGSEIFNNLAVSWRVSNLLATLVGVGLIDFILSSITLETNASMSDKETFCRIIEFCVIIFILV